MVRALAALAEDWSLVPSTHMTVHNIWNSRPRGSVWTLGKRDTHTIMLANTHTHKVRNTY